MRKLKNMDETLPDQCPSCRDGGAVRAAVWNFTTKLLSISKDILYAYSHVYCTITRPRLRIMLIASFLFSASNFRTKSLTIFKYL